MSTLDTSIPGQLRALIRLQYLDSQLDNLKKLQGSLPNEIRDLEDEKTGLETRLRNLTQEAEEDERTQKDAEASIRDSEALIKRYTEQQNTVRNNREYDALTKEIEAQRQRIIEAQARMDGVKNNVSDREITREEATVRLGELDTLLASKRSELSDVMDETRSEADAISERRTAATEAVDARYLNAYERLRSRVRDGRAVVPLERGAAGGYAVPPQRQVEIRQRTRIIPCENTGRIIVDEVLFREVGDEMSAQQV
ncbi:MAG: hypothetical protein IAE99_05810 [Rhodothermales bacterium]|nr:hypothetical protein [Rhodothermales bacterium]